MRKLKDIILVLSIILLVGCKTAKRGVEQNEIYSELSAKQLLDSVEVRMPRFESIEIAKYSAEFLNGNQKSNFSGYLRLTVDSMAMASISPFLGIEIARVMADKSAISMVDRNNKTWSKARYDSLQSPIADQFFPIFESLFTLDFAKLVKISRSQKVVYQNNLYNLTAKNRWVKSALFSYDNQFFLRQIYILSAQDVQIRVNYDNFEQVGAKFYPRQMVCYFVDGAKKYSLTLNINKINFDKPLIYDLKIGSDYIKLPYHEIF